MYTISSVIEKNRLYITLGELTQIEIQPILNDLNSHISNLSENFTCLVDIRQMKIGKDEKGSEYIEIIQGALYDAGMGRVIRVISKENLPSQKKMETGSMEVGYSGEPVYSIEEAELLFEKEER